MKKIMSLLIVAIVTLGVITGPFHTISVNEGDVGTPHQKFEELNNIT